MTVTEGAGFKAAIVGGIIIFLLFHCTRLLLYYNRKRLCSMPPGPLAWPIIGHLHLLDAKRPLHRTLSLLAHRYGNIMLLKFGFRRILIISSSALAKECLTTHDRNFASRPGFTGAEHLGYDCTALGLDPYDRRCRYLRRICTSQVLSPSIVEMLKGNRKDEVSKLLRDLYKRCTHMGTEQAMVVDVKSTVATLIFDMIVGIVADKSCLGGDEDVEELKELIKSTTSLLGAFNAGDYFPFLRWLDLQGCEWAMKKLNKRRDEILQRIVNAHRDRTKTEMAEKKKSLVDVLIHLVDKGEADFCSNDTIIKATTISMIIAAMETSSNVAEWAMALLLQRPDALKRAQDELDIVVGRDRVLEESDLPNLKYLEAIVKETLRLYPAGPLLLPRVAAESCTVGGYYVPAGTRLMVNAWVIHRDPAMWESPNEFEPERFMDYSASSLDVDGRDFRYIPFGYGRRSCPGMSLAMVMVPLIVGRLLQSFHWSIPEIVGRLSMEEAPSIALSKAVPLQSAIKPRLPRHLY